MIRQVVFPAAEQAELQEVAASAEPLAADQVEGRTICTLISAGTELAVYRKVLAGKPVKPGYAAVFRVDAVGAEVHDLKPGDLAFVMGGHKSRQRAERKNVLPVPAGLAPEHAVFARLMNVTLSTLTTTRARPPGKVIVSGLGLVGHLGAKAFSANGYTVLGVDPVAARAKLLAADGIAVAAHMPLDDPEWKAQTDLVLECSGHEAAVLAGCKVVRKGGEVVMVGVPWARRTEMYAHELLWEVFHNYAHLRSGWEWEIPHHPEDFKTGSLFAQMDAALRWIAAGRVKVEGLYKKVSPAACQDAYQSLLAQTCERLAIVFDWES